MKLSKLKNIIRESLNDLIVEQANNSSITVSPGDVVAVAAAYPIILNPQDLTIGPYGMNESPFANIFGSGNFVNGVYMSSGPSNYQISSNCGYARSYEIEDQAQADAFNSVFNGENGVYLELASTSNPNIGNAAYQATENVMAQLNANFQGQVNPTTYSSECYYIGGGAPSTPTSTPASPPEAASIGGIDPDADFFDSGAGASIDQTGESEFSFPSGFNPASWAEGWISNIFSFFDTGAGGGVPFANAAQVVPNACSFFASRVQTWTNQYSTAGPLYQNQLVFKLQLAYAMQDYFDCSEAPFDNYSFPFNPNEGLNEQMERSLPGNLKSIIDRIVQKVDQRLRSMIQKPAEPTKPAEPIKPATFEPKKDETDRLKKLANIPIDKPMDMPEKM